MTKNTYSQKKKNKLPIEGSPVHNAGSILMRQNSELYRQTLIRYDDEEIGGLLKTEKKADK